MKSRAAGSIEASPLVPPADRALTREQVSQLVGYAPKTLANMATLRIGPPFRRYRRRALYLESEVLAWLRSLPTEGEGVPR